MLISVDPGCGCTAWCAWRDGCPTTIGHAARVERGGVVVRRLLDVLDYLVPAVERAESTLVVEGQWLGPRRRGASPHADVLALACQRRAWECAAEVLGITHVVVPARWVGTLTRGLAPCADHTGRRDTERRLIARGRLRWPGLRVGDAAREPTPDEWAAVQLGEYWLAAFHP